MTQKRPAHDVREESTLMKSSTLLAGHITRNVQNVQAVLGSWTSTLSMMDQIEIFTARGAMAGNLELRALEEFYQGLLSLEN